MIFTETTLAGAFIIEPERVEDSRGFFARTWCRREFVERELDVNLAQCSLSFNHKSGTLRGMHYQTAPHSEVKLVRCTQGAIYDVIIDLRATSPTYTRHIAVTLSAENRTMLYIPVGFAHGFQTLMDDTEVCYHISAFYAPEHAHGVRWNDPVFGIVWPPATRTIIERDQNYPDFRPWQTVRA